MEISDLLEQINIVDYISQYVDLAPKNGEFWGRSPFNEDKTPSFSVRQETGQWYDFSSGKSGNLINFIMEYDGCNFRRALKTLERYANIDPDLVTIPRKLSATRVCERFAHPKPKKIELNTGHQFYPSDYMDRYEKRGDKLLVWMNEGISKDSLDRFNVAYDSFANRLVYPIKDINGNICNIGGRTLDPHFKEKGLRKYCYYNGWKDSFGGVKLLYGLYENLEYIKKKGVVIVFEGAKSVMMADTFGVKNTCAALTSHLNEDQMMILASLGVRVVFAFDQEVDVREDRNVQKLKHFTNVYYYRDPKGLLGEKDAPVDKGFDVFKYLMSNLKLLR